MATTGPHHSPNLKASTKAEHSSGPTTLRVVPTTHEAPLTNEETGGKAKSSSPSSEFVDVMPDEIPEGLPPLRGIEHQINLIPEASSPNRAVYRVSPKKTKELQRQVTELLQKGYIREGLSPCGILVILVPEKEGFVVSRDGLRVDEEKVHAIKEWPTPTTATMVRFFLGLARFYRGFVRDFSSIAAPLHELTKKGTTITWEPKHEAAFMTLKDHLCHAPLLQLSNFNKTFEVVCDASNIGIGGVLIQERRPMRFWCYVTESEKLMQF
ncbi:uncharacterized protein LOC125369827 [Ricinus communis]|uniref:uncharacterized protein LOC125369827 n=1 Tax=Ricinus communis TaxID=3988 RepID=UPI00201AC31E|nr:uncharacterized protein LOC125369827 [Ricinus communis]